MSTNELITKDDLQAMQTLAEVFIASGLFSDTKNMAQAIVKIMAGREMRLGPFESMRDLNIIQGKTTLAAAQIAARIKGTNQYDYEVVEFSDQKAVLRFTKGGKPLNPLVEFSLDHAKKMGLAGKDNYLKQSRTMLFWRAVTMGARMFCPHVFGGAIYTPDELRGGEVDDLPSDIIPAPLEPQTRDVEPRQSRPSVVSAPDTTEELPPPLNNPWMHMLEGVARSDGGNLLQAAGKYLAEMPNVWFGKAAAKSSANKLSPADKANIFAAIAFPEGRDEALEEILNIRAKAFNQNPYEHIQYVEAEELATAPLEG